MTGQLFLAAVRRGQLNAIARCFLGLWAVDHFRLLNAVAPARPTGIAGTLVSGRICGWIHNGLGCAVSNSLAGLRRRIDS